MITCNVKFIKKTPTCCCSRPPSPLPDTQFGNEHSPGLRAIWIWHPGLERKEMLCICQLDSARRPQGPRNRSLHYFGLRSKVPFQPLDMINYMLHFSSRGQWSAGAECCAMFGRMLKAVKQPWPRYLLRLCQRSGEG